MRDVLIGAMLGAATKDLSSLIWLMLRKLMFKLLVKSADDVALWWHHKERHGPHHPKDCHIGRCATIK